MAISRLAVSKPSSGTDTLIYTRTGSRVALASIIATNQDATDATMRVWVVPNGQDATPANHAVIAYDFPVGGLETFETFRFPLVSLDKVYVRASTSNISFILSGVDNTAVAETEFTAVQEKANSKASYFLLMGA